jgi:hydrogenase maturation protease
VTESGASVLVAGVGNPDRSDDGAGPLVARAVRSAALPGVEAIEVGGDVSRLIEALADREAAVIVDAAVTGAAPGTVHRLDSSGVWALRRHGTSSHGIGVAEVVALAAATGVLPRRLEVLAIEGTSFGHGDAPTDAVARACRAVARELVVRFGGRP